MFNATPVSKVNIVISESDVKDLVSALANEVSIEISPVENGRGEGGEPWEAYANQYDALQHRMDRLIEILDVELDDHNPESVDPGKDYAAILQELQNVEEIINASLDRNEQKELGTVIREIKMLKPLDVPVEDLRDMEHIHFVVGTMPRQNLLNLSRSLFQIPYIILPFQQLNGDILVIATTTQKAGPILDMALKSAFFNPIKIRPEITGRPKDVLADLEEEREKICEQKTQADLEVELQKIREEKRETLACLQGKIARNLALARVISQLDQHANAYLVQGWVPNNQLAQINQIIERVTWGHAEVQIIEPATSATQNPPTLLHTPSWLKPFETIINNFGIPGYEEINPTLLVALSFMLMFGMMFGDVGHGLLLALAGFWLWKKQNSSLGAVLMANGISGSIFGFLYGSFFGKEDILPPLWLNPMKDILSILAFSGLAGVGLLIVGFGLNIWNTGRSKKWGEMIFGYQGLIGLLFYLSLLGGSYSLLQGLTFPVHLWLVLNLALMITLLIQEPLGSLLQGGDFRPEPGWKDYLILSPFELFQSVLEYISNSLSFVRLGAFAIAHAGVSRVVFSIADQMGAVGKLIVILFGTLLIVGFEGLVVSIQTLRLEYYEFFGKFFMGNGRPFKPLTLPGKNVKP